MNTLIKNLSNYLLIPLALFILISNSAFSNELIKDSRLKAWIKKVQWPLPGLTINADGGIDSTEANLEALAKVEYFHCAWGDLISINELLRHMPNLKKLECHRNSLIKLDVSNNTKLEELSCYRNGITNLDVSNNTELKYLDCSYNRLSNLDMSKNIKLEELYCWSNGISNLDVSNSIELTSLNCAANLLTNLDISKSIKLKELICYGNKLNKLDLSNNIELTYLKCNYNRVSKLDMSKNIKLTFLDCSINGISNLEISKNINLEKLDCSSNPISNLDISKNIKLKLLSCAINGLTNLDVSKNIELRDLYCSYNQLSELDISPLLNLVSLRCCNQAEDFTLSLTSEQKNKFDKGSYCNAILKEKAKICKTEWLGVYPNPTSDRFFIESNSLSDEIKILNLSGEILYRKTLNAGKTEIDISSMPTGVYFIKTKEKTGKFIKN